MRSYPLTALQGGISRLRVKGAARANTLYDLTNAYLTQAGSIVPREGTILSETLDDTTVGLLAIDGVFNVFSSSSGATVPSSHTLNLLINPGLTTDTPRMIWFAKPFMGFPYVVCEFESGDILHYWLQNDGEWTASSTYYTDNVIIPTTPNGLGYQAVRDMPVNPTWAALTSTSAGSIVEPTEYTGFAYVAVTVSGPLPFTGSIEPTWPTVAGGIIQEFGNFDLNSNDSGTVNSSGTTVTSGPLTLGSTITDRYGDSSDIAGQTGTFTVASTSAVYALPLVTTWAPGTQYPTGSVVVPTTTQGAYINAIPNGDFEDGNDGNWAFSNGDVSIVDQEADAYQGDYCLKFALNQNSGFATMTTYGAVSPGQSVTATAYLDPNNEGGNLGMWLNLVWFDSSQTLLSTSKSSGGGVDGGADGFGYRKVSITANAPANAAYVQAQIEAVTGTSGINPGFADLVSWSLETPSAITNFVYEAIQATTGVSGTTQPAWPTVLGNTVDDGTVVWEAVGTSIITWQAIPIMQSGGAGVVETIQVSSSGTGYVAGTYDGVITSTNNSGVGCTLDIIIQTSSVTSATIAGGGSGYAVGDLLFVSNSQLGGTGSGFVATVNSINSTSGEPDFPFQIGAIVYDASTYTDVNGTVHNTSMSWECIARNITDPNCPNSIPVALGASHVFAGDDDICDFSAAVNPTDWTSEDNAGYLPTGTNNYGNNPIAALALYRSNLIVFNSGGYQMWQIDPDPENMALLDAEPVGSTWPLSCQSVANDLLFLTEVGVRNLGIAGATANLQIGNTGQPIDPLIKAQLIAASTNGYIPRSLYYPGRGQYWIMFGPQAFVLTMNGNGIKSWSRYTFPSTITDWTLNSGVLYLRTSNNLVLQFDYETLGDESYIAPNDYYTMSIISSSGYVGFPNESCSFTGWYNASSQVAVTFTSGSSTFSIPTGVSTVGIYVVGGGASGYPAGASGSASEGGGGGGSGGFTSTQVSTSSITSTLYITVGSGGPAALYGGSPANGTSSYVGSSYVFTAAYLYASYGLVGEQTGGSENPGVGATKGSCYVGTEIVVTSGCNGGYGGYYTSAGSPGAGISGTDGAPGGGGGGAVYRSGEIYQGAAGGTGSQIGTLNIYSGAGATGGDMVYEGIGIAPAAATYGGGGGGGPAIDANGVITSDVLVSGGAGGSGLVVIAWSQGPLGSATPVPPEPDAYPIVGAGVVTSGTPYADGLSAPLFLLIFDTTSGSYAPTWEQITATLTSASSYTYTLADATIVTSGDFLVYEWAVTSAYALVSASASTSTVFASSYNFITPFVSTLQWPYLDMGTLGAKKMLAGVDIVGVGSCAMQIAYMQSDPTTFSDNANFSTCSNVTSAYVVSIADTLPGTPIPLPLNAPSYSLILSWNSDQPGLEAPNSQSWEWDGANLWMADQSGIGGM